MSHYPSYQVSDSNGFPEHWQARRLRFAVKLNPSKNEIPLSDSELVSFVPMDAVGEYGGIRLDEDKELGEIGSGYTYFRDNDVVVAKITPCFENGKGAIAKGLTNECAFGTTELHVLRADLELLDPDFLFYLTVSNWFRDLGESEMYGAGGQKRVPEDFIKDLVTGLPPKTEQQAIVGFLNHKTAQIDVLIAKKQSLLDKLAEQRTALISQAVTKGLDPSVPMKDSGVDWLGEIPAHWNAIRVRHISEFVTSGSRGWAQYYSNDGNVFLRITNVSRHSVDLLRNDIQRVSPPRGAEGDRTKTSSGDIVVSITADLGSVAVIPEGYEEAYVSQHLALIRPQKGRVYPRWLAYQVFSQHGKAQLTGAGYGGTKIQLSLPDIKDLWISLPPLDSQKNICTAIDAKVEKLELQCSKVHKIIEKLHEHRAALITNAVTGKIDVRDFSIPATTAQKELAHG
jgi:type I restriction enzyme S subunit